MHKLFYAAFNLRTSQKSNPHHITLASIRKLVTHEIQVDKYLSEIIKDPSVKLSTFEETFILTLMEVRALQKQKLSYPDEKDDYNYVRKLSWLDTLLSIHFNHCKDKKPALCLS